MNNKYKLIPLILSGFIFNAHATDEIINRDYVQVSYEQTDYDEELTLRGYSFLGSKKVTDEIYITAEYVSMSDDVEFLMDDVGVDQTEISIGAGYTYNFNEKTEFFAHLAITNIEVESGGASFEFFDEQIDIPKYTEDETGYDLTIGSVYRFNNSWEGSLILNHKDVIEGNTGIGGSILYHFTDWLSIGTTYVTYDDFDETNINARFSF